MQKIFIIDRWNNYIFYIYQDVFKHLRLFSQNISSRYPLITVSDSDICLVDKIFINIKRLQNGFDVEFQNNQM